MPKILKRVGELKKINIMYIEDLVSSGRVNKSTHDFKDIPENSIKTVFVQQTAAAIAFPIITDKDQFFAEITNLQGALSYEKINVNKICSYKYWFHDLSEIMNLHECAGPCRYYQIDVKIPGFEIIEFSNLNVSSDIESVKEYFSKYSKKDLEDKYKSGDYHYLIKWEGE